jgi:hypothetical protein
LVCGDDEWCDYGGMCPAFDDLGECRKQPTVAQCLPAPPATCAQRMCACNGAEIGCDWCGAHRAGFTIKACP